ncbi:MAG: hypothetical protein SAK29_43215, partial [Scytonema sp. PMC 1069.18]|nr:hypothetical protein [Scytonema sp. PMC 1069.18]
EVFQPTTSPIETTQVLPTSSTKVSPSTVCSTETTQLPSTPTTEKSTVFHEVVENEQQSIANITSIVTNTQLSTKINPSDNLESLDSLKNQDSSLLSQSVSQGFATGGYVTNTYVENNQQIAPSDTVPAMLTPGEFVINARDAQQNLNLLKHINSGGKANDAILPNLDTSTPKEQQETTSVESPTKVDSLEPTSLQLKNYSNISSQASNSLISPSLRLDIENQRSSILSSSDFKNLNNKTTDASNPSIHYSSPSLIFRKKNPSMSTNTPSQWSNVEDLLNIGADGFTVFNSDGVESNHQNYEFSPPNSSQISRLSSENTKVLTKTYYQPKGFADGGEVSQADTNTIKQPISETIERQSSSLENEDNDADLEVLAREIYSRLRQRLEIERERYGVYSGRLPW